MAQTYIRPIVTYPAIKQLARSDWRAALAIYKEIMEAGPGAIHNEDAAGTESGDDLQAHNVPVEELTRETLKESPATASANYAAHAENKQHEQPSERALLTNAGWIEFPTTHKGRSQPIGWAMRDCDGRIVEADGKLQRPEYDYDRGRPVHARLGGLTFNVVPGLRKSVDGGQLISFLDGNGKPQKPAISGAERGKSRQRRRVDVVAYLARPAAIASPLQAASYQRPCRSALHDAYDPLPGKEEARAELARLMADYDGPITKCPTAIARGARFLAGVASGSETKSTPAPIWEAPEKRGLNHILGEVAAGGDFADVGRAAGYRGKFTANASHKGKKALLREAGAIMERAANAGNPLPTEPDEVARTVIASWRAKEAFGAARAKLYRADNDNNEQQRAVA